MIPSHFVTRFSQSGRHRVDKIKKAMEELIPVYILNMAESVIDITSKIVDVFKLKDKVKNLFCRFFLGPFKTCGRREL